MGTRRTSSPRRENIVAGATFGVLAAAALSAGAWSLSNLSDYHSAALVAESEQRAAEEAAERADQNSDPNDPDGGSAPVENDESSTSSDGPTEGPDDSDTSGDSSASDDADERGDDSKSSSEDKDSKSSSKEESSSDEKSSDSDDEETVPADTVWHVEAGDTLASISAETGVSVDALVEHNSIANPNLIYAGSALRVPAV